jgi:uracil-DNA glycosylase
MDAAVAASALRWWLESGVDVAVSDRPASWLQLPANSPAAPEIAPAQTTSATEPPHTLPLFRDWLANAAPPPARAAAARRVLPLGEQGAPLMILADAPGADEAKASSPVAGEALALTERMMAAIGLPMSSVYLANISCFHSPGSRLGGDELAQCAEIARRHVALVAPRRLLLLGDGPCTALLRKTVHDARGHVQKVEGVRTVATYHPRLLISRQQLKAEAWKDLLLLMEDAS